MINVPHCLRLIINCHDYNSNTPDFININTFDINTVPHTTILKHILHTIMKLFLILLIFGGLQGRVLVRYAEVFNPKRGHETYTQKGTSVQAEIVHCKLQCFTEQFHSMALPGVLNLLIFTLFGISITVTFLPFRERPAYADTLQRSFLRGPPVFS